MEPQFGYQFPAIRGTMAGRAYYVSMCPMRLIPRIFLFDEEEAALPAELRAQRSQMRKPKWVWLAHEHEKFHSHTALAG